MTTFKYQCDFSKAEVNLDAEVYFTVPCELIFFEDDGNEVARYDSSFLVMWDRYSLSPAWGLISGDMSEKHGSYHDDIQFKIATDNAFFIELYRRSASEIDEIRYHLRDKYYP